MLANPTNGQHAKISSLTIEDAVRAEENLYLVYGNIGVVANSRKNFITVATLGNHPVKVADGQTFTAFTPLKNNGSNEAVPALAGEPYFGYSTAEVTATSGNWVDCMITPGNLI